MTRRGHISGIVRGVITGVSPTLPPSCAAPIATPLTTTLLVAGSTIQYDTLTEPTLANRALAPQRLMNAWSTETLAALMNTMPLNTGGCPSVWE